MSWSPTPEQLRKERFWRTPPPDPTRLAKRAGVPYHARRSRARDTIVLMPSDFMPVGEHAGKHLHQVPAEYLLWVDSQPWAAHWPQWAPVHDYLARFPLPEAIEMPSPPLHLGPLLPQPGSHVPALRAGAARLYTLPGWEDYLHAYVIGALRLSRDYYHPAAPPHYLISRTLHQQSLTYPSITPTPPETTADHKDLWIQFFRTKPHLPQ